MLLSALLLSSGSSYAASKTLTYESATSANGPWTKIDPATVQVSPSGAITVDTAATAATFFRMRVAADGEETAIPVVTLAQVPANTLAAARSHLLRSIADGGEPGDAWADVEIAPFAAPISDSSKGERPSHFAFKLTRKVVPARATGFRKFDSEEVGSIDRGYMICSGDENDLPIVEFATEGGTPIESLLRKCRGVAPSRIIRYGAAFWVAENAKGELIANHGTEPFRPPAGFAELTRQTFTGLADTETGVEQRPPATKLTPSFYRDYSEFKADYETNAIYRLLRSRRVDHAKAFWNAERGISPTTLAVPLGGSASFFPGVQVDAIIIDLESDERPIADVVRASRIGGITIDGNIAGRMAIKLRVDDTITRYVVEVQARTAGVAADKSVIAHDGAPFWKTAVESYAGSWGDQMRWWQLKDSDWCQAVGCGPTAIAMLLGWWEHHNNVKSAFFTSPTDFNSLNTVDSSQSLDTNAKKATLKKVYAQLHDYCDVICDPFSDAGATMPGDLIEGYFDYIHPVGSSTGVSSLLYGQGKNLVGYSFSWAYDFWGDDWDSSGSRVANGIKAGQPGVVGLGWLWHYVVAYGYVRQDYTVNINGTDHYLGLRKRFFKVNEGWGKESPAWYSAYDVFLGLTVNMYQKTTPKQP